MWNIVSIEHNIININGKYYGLMQPDRYLCYCLEVAKNTASLIVNRSFIPEWEKWATDIMSFYPHEKTYRYAKDTLRSCNIYYDRYLKGVDKQSGLISAFHIAQCACECAMIPYEPKITKGCVYNNALPLPNIYPALSAVVHKAAHDKLLSADISLNLDKAINTKYWKKEQKHLEDLYIKMSDISH